MRIVSQRGIGSGPGMAKRASTPVTKAGEDDAMIARASVSVARHDEQRDNIPAAPFVHAVRLRPRRIARRERDYTDELPALAASSGSSCTRA